jgi:hypothetical protein
MTLTTLVTGTSAAARETAIASLLDINYSAALILEGLPDGGARFSHVDDVAHIRIFRIAPGCVCCTGNLTLRVTLNRILRHQPERLYISLATATHLHEIRQFLTHAPYDQYLQLAQDLHI